MNIFKRLKNKYKMDNKTEALKRLSALEEEATKLRTIIENADKPKSLLERVIDVESAIKELPTDDEEVKIYYALKGAGIGGHNLAYQELVIACKALCEGKTPPPNNRYVPWFDFSKTPGSGFDRSVCARYHGFYRSVSVRLSLLNSEHAKHCGKYFEKTWYTYLTKK